MDGSILYLSFLLDPLSVINIALLLGKVLQLGNKRNTSAITFNSEYRRKLSFWSICNKVECSFVSWCSILISTKEFIIKWVMNSGLKLSSAYILAAWFRMSSTNGVQGNTLKYQKSISDNNFTIFIYFQPNHCLHKVFWRTRI